MKAVQLTQTLSALVEAGPPSDKAMGLLAVAHARATTGNLAGATEAIQGAVANVEMCGSDAEKSRMFERMANLLIKAGQYKLAQIVWRARMAQAQFSGRREMLGVIELGVPLIARIDGGQALWRLYKTVMDIEAWRESKQ